jgi:transposase
VCHTIEALCTTVSGYWTVSKEGLFQHGHSKDHRPDLPQLKVMMSALDPMGMPVATQVVSGERADDKLYIPAIKQVSISLEEHGLLYVGDCKMGALGIRAFIQNSEDYYLCPLSEVQLPKETLETYLQPGLEWNPSTDTHRASKCRRPIGANRRRIRTKYFVECRNRP